MAQQEFAFPAFWNYPPYFTLQPVEETRRKQIALWCELTLRWCKEQKVYKLTTEIADEVPLFSNKQISRSLNTETRVIILQTLVANGNGFWLNKTKSQCLVLWKKLPDWAKEIYQWAQSVGLEESVTTVDEISQGEDCRGTDLEGLPRELILEAVKILEAQRKAKLFKGSSADDVGIKFFA